MFLVQCRDPRAAGLGSHAAAGRAGHLPLSRRLRSWGLLACEPMAIDTLQTWHRIARERDVAGLGTLLADDVVFHSPIVHAPQRGKPVKWNAQGQIVEFKVMVRPLNAINLIHQKMAAMLQAGPAAPARG